MTYRPFSGTTQFLQRCRITDSASRWSSNGRLVRWCSRRDVRTSPSGRDRFDRAGRIPPTTRRSHRSRYPRSERPLPREEPGAGDGYDDTGGGGPVLSPVSPAGTSCTTGVRVSRSATLFTVSFSRLIRTRRGVKPSNTTENARIDGPADGGTDDGWDTHVVRPADGCYTRSQRGYPVLGPT